MIECGVRGGTVVQTWSARTPAYFRGYNHSRGRAVCSNSLVVGMHLADEAVLRAVTRDVLDPEVVGEALELALRDIEQPAAAGAARVDTLKNELVRLEAELSRYAEAIADAGPLATILQALKVREQRRDTSEIRAELVEYLGHWRDMARQGVAEARRLLRAVLVGRFVFTPVIRPSELPPRRGPGRKPRFIYEKNGEASLSGLIAGVNVCKFGGGPNGIRTGV
jgi:hypothetical protein